MTNALDVLGLDSNPSDDDVLSAYRKQARLYHPDNFDPEQLDSPAEAQLDANKLFMDVQKSA